MALIQQASLSAKKAINLAFGSSAAVLYTVPAGKTFTGNVCGSASGTSGYCTINGASFYPISGGTVWFTTYTGLLTFPAGTVFSSTTSSGGMMLIGIEQ